MHRKALAVIAFAALAAALPFHAPATTPKPRPKATQAPRHAATPLPIIYHGEVSPLCAALARHVKPVIGMMLQNDQTISHSPPLFRRYNADVANETQNHTSGNSAERDLTLYHLEQLVTPLSKNVLAMQKELQDPSIFPPHPKNDAERQLDQMRIDLLKALATQAVSLDIINGFVTTQQLAEMQHEGLEGSDINAINRSDTTYSPPATTPNPILVDPKQAGIPANPYEMNPLAIPGITGSVGSTPVTRLLAALQWVQQETNRREQMAAQTVLQANRSCAAPAPTPTP